MSVVVLPMSISSASLTVWPTHSAVAIQLAEATLRQSSRAASASSQRAGPA